MQFLAIQYEDTRPFQFFINGKRTTKARYHDAYDDARRNQNISCLHTKQGRNRRGETIFRHFSSANPKS